MDEAYQMVYVEKPEESAWGIIGRGIHSYNVQHAGDEKFQRLCFVLQTAGEEVVGGVIGELFWGWFHIDLLSVDRNQASKGMVMTKEKPKRCFTISHSHRRQRASGRS